MLRKDFIMVQIEELGKVIAQIVSQRDTDAARKIPQLVETVYASLKLDRDFLFDSTPEKLEAYLNGEDGEGLKRMEIAAKLLIEEAYLYPTRQAEIRQKAKGLLEYIQAHDNTFSLERISLLQGLSD